MSQIFRYVIVERDALGVATDVIMKMSFIGFREVNDSSASKHTREIVASVEDNVLDLSKCRGQGLDHQSGTIPTQGIVLENQWRDLENMKAQFVTVNGIRKLACVLRSNLRHVRVFEMDVEDEEDEERPESQNANSNQDGLEETLASQGEAGGNDTEGNREGAGPSAAEQRMSGEALELS
ncbi:hypothetical protein UPYG_G00029280 [Umbra pygmaea]|uniref:Anaphase-promoting complex subunit 4 C-terminal half WD40 domain-containing protein n=1 Tax=Umbra pygmaea TaxID=75934 RepID=A0ABD0XPE9_UMBPY